MVIFTSILNRILDPQIDSKIILVFCLFISIILIFITTARILQFYFKEKSLGIITLALWSILIILSLFFDYFHINTWILIGLLSILLIFFFIISIYIKKIKLKEVFTSEVIALYISYLFAILILSLVLSYISPANTFIPAQRITNDSIVHSILAKGYESTDLIGLNPYFNDNYPRGFHSLIFHISKVFSFNSIYILFAASASAYAMFIFTAQDILSNYREIKLVNKIVLILFPLFSFLPLYTLYALYIPQIVVIPLLITAIYQIFKSDLKKIDYKEIFILFSILIGIAAVYGANGLSVVAIALLIKLVIYIMETRGKFLIQDFSTTWLNLKTYLRDKWTYVSLLILGVISIPVIITLINNLVSSLKTSETTFGIGSDFYSPLHITGFWFFDTYAKGIPGPRELHLFLLIFFFQIYFVLKGKIDRHLKSTLATIGLLFCIFSIVYSTPYIAFKYLSFLVPPFILSFGLGFYTLFKSKMHYIVSLTIVVFAAVSFISYAGYFKNLESRDDDFFSNLEYLQKNYLKGNSVFIYGGDTWLNHFKLDDTDIFQSTWYYPKYTGQDFDYALIEDVMTTNLVIKKEYDKFLLKNEDFKKSLESVDESCITEKAGFIIYDFNCNE